jgi:hypothetical protein
VYRVQFILFFEPKLVENFNHVFTAACRMPAGYTIRHNTHTIAADTRFPKRVIIMRVNFVFQDDRGRYSDKLAKVELIDTEQRKLVKDALDILKKRQVPSRTWGVESVRVRC